MISLLPLLGLVGAGVHANPISDTDHNLEARQAITSSQTGTNGGYYYSFYNGGANVDYYNDAAGEYSVTWDGGGDFVAGKGWNPGSAQVIEYSGTWAPVDDGNAYLSVYGWTTDPLVEYYITDAIGDYNPGSAATLIGSVTSDGGTYDIYTDQRIDQPSILGTSNFSQYWSIRTTNRIGGTVTTENHFNAWASHGLELGTFNYQILATEGYGSSGSADITVGVGVGTTSTTTGSTGTATSTSKATSTTSSSGSTSTQVALYGQCGGIGWTGGTVCAPGGTCTYGNAYYSQCLP